MTSAKRCGVERVFKVFEEVEKLSKPGDKLAKLSTIKDCFEFRWIAKIVYDNTIKTYVSDRVLIKFQCGNKQIATFDEFIELVGLLVNRKLTGKRKEEALKEFFLKCDQFHCKWYKRILAKDLRIGVGVSLISQLLGWTHKDLGIQVRAMLATEISQLPNPEAHIQKYDWHYEPKVDGLRVLTIFTDNKIYCYSRNGKRLEAVEKFVARALTKDIKLYNGLVIDGEWYSKDWSRTMTSVFTKKKEIPYDPSMKYYVFDCLTVEEIEKGYSPVGYIRRKQRLEKIKSYFQEPIVYMPYYHLNTKDLRYIFDLAEKYVKRGFEGIMLKVSDSPYECKRSKYWVKVKLFKTIDLLCVDIVPSHKNPDEIAAIIVLYKGKRCKCGSGFTQEQRKLFRKHPELIVGKIVEIRYQEESKDGCLRFPVFIRVREDKDVPDA